MFQVSCQRIHQYEFDRSLQTNIIIKLALTILGLLSVAMFEAGVALWSLSCISWRCFSRCCSCSGFNPIDSTFSIKNPLNDNICFPLAYLYNQCFLWQLHCLPWSQSPLQLSNRLRIIFGVTHNTIRPPIPTNTLTMLTILSPQDNQQVIRLFLAPDRSCSLFHDSHHPKHK